LRGRRKTFNPRRGFPQEIVGENKRDDRDVVPYMMGTIWEIY